MQHLHPLGLVEIARDPVERALAIGAQLVRSEIAAHRHRKSFKASHPQPIVHAARIAISGATEPHPSPRSIVARSASFVAVNGSALMNGWKAAGKFSDEKNTPDNTHIGTIDAFMSPDAPSMVWARDAINSPNAPNANVDISTIAVSWRIDPRSGTSNTTIAKPSTRTTSAISNPRREITNAIR